MVGCFMSEERKVSYSLSPVSTMLRLEPANMRHETFMQEAIRLAEEGMQSGRGGPFGCVIVRAGRVGGRGHNRVTSTNNPTAHAEVVAIRDACANLETFQLTNCALYTSCEPAPMCLSAIYCARNPSAYYGNTRENASTLSIQHTPPPPPDPL